MFQKKALTATIRITTLFLIFDAVPVVFGGLFHLVFAGFIVGSISDNIWEILLGDPVARVVMGIIVKLTWVVVVLAVEVLVLQLAGDSSIISGADIRHGGVNSLLSAV